MRDFSDRTFPQEGQDQGFESTDYELLEQPAITEPGLPEEAHDAADGPIIEIIEAEDSLDIARLMEHIGVAALQTDAERYAFLQELMPEQLIQSIDAVSNTARGVEPDSNRPANWQRSGVVNSRRWPSGREEIVAINYIAPRRDLGEQAVADALEIAKNAPDLAQVGRHLGLIIPLAHLNFDGNGAASRFFRELIAKGYDGSPEADEQYRQLLAKRDSNPQLGAAAEDKWRRSYAPYLSKEVQAEHNLPFIPKGQIDFNWQGFKAHRYPFMQQGYGTFFLEDSFGIPFSMDLMAQTGRDIREFTTPQWEGLRKNHYIQTEKLVLDASQKDERPALRVLDAHKSAFLKAVNDHFASRGRHPAFRGIRP